MRIAEVFKSIQGEGLLTGTESVFVRVAGCNLRCWYCDTPYASWHPEGEDLSVEDILQSVDDFGSQHVVLTGGEPMLFSEMIPLCEGLRAAGRHITVETAGTLYLPLECDLMSISPKTANSTPTGDLAPRWHLRHDHTRHAPDVIRQLVAEHRHQLKFVVARPEDGQQVQQWLREFPEVARSQVLLMPMGTETEELRRVADWAAPYCREHGFTYCPRKQIEWFGLVRGT